MGMDITVYTKELSEDLIPKIKKRFTDFHMDIEFHPDFKFNEDDDIGFLPIRLKVRPGRSKHYDKIGYDVLTGFELLFADYDYDQHYQDTYEFNGTDFVSDKELD